MNPGSENFERLEQRIGVLVGQLDEFWPPCTVVQLERMMDLDRQLDELQTKLHELRGDPPD